MEEEEKKKDSSDLRLTNNGRGLQVNYATTISLSIGKSEKPKRYDDVLIWIGQDAAGVRRSIVADPQQSEGIMGKVSLGCFTYSPYLPRFSSLF